MAVDSLSLDDFLDRFDESLAVSSQYTLILGAGASRSAGIPTAGEIEQVFRKIARHRGRSIDNPGNESDWSFLFRTALGPENEHDDDSVPEGANTFVSRIVALGSREANLTSLIAANLASLQVCPLIVTTNYDDLLLAGFWSLPAHIPYSEPRIIYNAREIHRRSFRHEHGTPIVLKAHGHHTEYAVSIVDNEVQDLAPHVQRLLMEKLPRPDAGYIVVGYSGAWDDGIMRSLKEPSLVSGKDIYWFHARPQPPKEIAFRIHKKAKLHFVHCSDADFLFLNLWHLSNPGFSRNALDAGELFCPLDLDDRLVERSATTLTAPWWTPGDPPPPEKGWAAARAALNLEELAAKVLPILDDCDSWENERIRDRCLPPDMRLQMRIKQKLFDDLGDDEDPPALAKLREAVPARVAWGRRDRRLLRLALHPDIDPQISFAVMEAFTKFR